MIEKLLNMFANIILTMHGERVVRTSINTILSILGLRTLPEMLKLLEKTKPLKLVLEYASHSDVSKVKPYLDLLLRASRSRIKYQVLKRNYSSDFPSPCIHVEKDNRKFTYCGGLDELLFIIVLEAIAVLGESLKPQCPPRRKGAAPHRLKVFVVSGLPCLITGLSIVDYFACTEALEVVIIDAIAFNNLMRKKIIRSVPITVIDDNRVVEGMIPSPKVLDGLLNEGGGVWAGKR